MAEDTEQVDPPETEADASTKPQAVPAPTPTSVLGEITPRQPVNVTPDGLDAQFDRARDVITNDDLLTSSDKEMKLLELEVMREQRVQRRQQTAQSDEDRVRASYAKQYGVESSVVDATWNEAAGESIRRRGRFDYGTAMTIFEDRLAGSKKEPTPLADKKPVGQTRTEPRGARQVASQPEKKLTVQEILDRAAAGDTSAIPADVMAEARR